MTIPLALSAWRDNPPALDVQFDLEHPWVMPLVLRVERGVEISHQEALSAAAQAVALMMIDERSAPGNEWHYALNTWMLGRIRKVVRRARASKWDTVVSDLSGITVCYKNAEVYIVPPHPSDSIPNPLQKLQVSGLDLPISETSLRAIDPPVLHIAINPDLTMSTGKAMAQVGHASQIALLRLPESLVTAWIPKHKVLVHLDRETFLQAPVTAIEIEDAGFTEIPAGSLTAKAWID